MSWKEVELGSVCKFINGDRGKNYPSQSAFVQDGIPFINAGDLNNYRIEKNELNFITEERYNLLGGGKLQKNDILFCLRGSLGKFAINDEGIQGAIASSLVLIRVQKELYIKYLYHYLKSPEISRLVKKSDNGSSQPNLSAANVKKFQIPLPPLPQQQKIANILDAADALRQKDKALLAKYDKLTQALFLEMFGNPVSNPMGWEKVELKHFGKIITGNTPSRNDDDNYSSQHIEWLKTDNIKEDLGCVTIAKEYLSEKGLASARTVESGALLVACIAGSIKSIGRAALTDRRVSFNQQINAIQPNKEILPSYLFYLFKSTTSYIQEHASNGMKRMLTKGVFEKIQMIKPPLQLQNLFAERIKIIEQQKAIAQKSLEKSEELFNSLLQKAFKGELS